MKVSELVRRDFCESNHLHKEVAIFAQTGLKMKS